MTQLRTGLLAIASTLALAACQSPASQPADAARESFMPASLTPEGVAAADEFLWLEEVDSPRSLAWVADQNARTNKVLAADPRYETYRSEALAILTAQDRTPTPGFRADGIDNFWQDATHVRGVWRRTTLDSYRSPAPQWTTVLDIDALAKSESANWIYKGVACLAPDETRCLINLSDGGKDAVVVREFDTTTGAFVEGGFNLPEGKHRLAWLDRDTLLVATDFGAGTLTESGYPFVVKALKRGQTLTQAAEVYRGDAGDGGYGVNPSVYRDSKGDVLAVLISRPLDTFRSEIWELKDGATQKLNLPERVSVRGALSPNASGAVRLVFTAEQTWRAASRDIAAGSLLAVDLAALRMGDALSLNAGDPIVFAPNARQSIEDTRVFDHRIVATIYDNVRGRAIAFDDAGLDGWKQRSIAVPDNVAVHLGSSRRSAQTLFLTYEGFLTPSTLTLVDAANATSETIRQSPARFDSSNHVVEQYEATSKDGTKIPYFITHAKQMPAGGAPTLMYGYGGFQVSYLPTYRPEMGKLWLERGGVYVVANIRGGGEFGPTWHQAALKENRQRAFDDFAAVSADLVARGFTTADKLGIYGRSNGGVLTSAAMTQNPQLIGAVVIESPLVDMLRYHLLPPGASWMGEYGDPRIPAEAAWIAAYSGYQNVKPGMKYPEPYITTNMRDDRVHPGHARKFAARLQAMGYPALYFENTDGGHSNDSDPILNAERWARHYIYLARQLAD